MDPARPEAGLGDDETGALGPEQVRGRNAAVAVADLAVPTAAGVAHHRHRPDDLETGIVDRDDHHVRDREQERRRA